MTPYSAFSMDQRQQVLTSLRQLCRLFWGPDIGQSREILEGRFFESFCAATNPVASSFSPALQEIQAYTRRFFDPEGLYRALETTYVRLFVSSRGGIAVPLYQSCYALEGASLMGPSAVDMQRRLKAVELNMAGHAAGEPPDHLAIELEYLYFLLEKGWAGDNKAYLDTAQHFAAETLGAWIDAFTQRLGQSPDPAVYAPAAGFTAALIRIIAQG
ncbi:MAG: molecular chaperone TorD family protein [Desulfobacterales bacterium]|jgi:TorA-specific chaperone|nr:molecular chaperone TorD family protein [Desulfobacterales bacterium]